MCEHCSAGLVEPAETTERQAPAQAPFRQTGIARFQNGADAGFFADELSREAGIVVEVLARERFDATHGYWLIDYVLHVAHDEAPRAAAMLRALVEATEDGVASADDEQASSPTPSRGSWVPLVLTLAAGSMACWGIQHFEQRPRGAALVVRDPREPPDPTAVAGALAGTWVQHDARGPVVGELLIDLERQTATITEDHNGDGRPDRRWELPLRRALAPR